MSSQSEILGSLVTPPTLEEASRRVYGKIWTSLDRRGSELAACLPVLLKALNWRGNPRQIYESLPHRPEKMDRVHLLNTLAGLGYVPSPVRVRLDRLDDRLSPCLFIPDGHDGQTKNAMVILGRSEEGGPGTLSAFCGGREEIVSLNPGTAISGTIYVCKEAGDEEQPTLALTRAATGFGWFRALMERFRRNFAQIFVASIAVNLIGLGMPLIVMAVYDKVIGAHSELTLRYLAIGVGLAIATEAVLRFARLRSICWFGSRIDNLVSNAIFEQLLYLPAQFTERSSTAAQLARIRSFESVREFFTGPLFVAVLELPFVIILILAIAAIGGSLAVIPIIMAGGYIAVLLIFRPRLQVAIHAGAKASTAKQRLGLETFSKISTLRQSGMTELWRKRFEGLSGRASYANFQSSFIAAKIETFAHALSAYAALAVIVAGVGRIWAGDMTVGALIATMILTWRALSPLHAACASLPRLEQLRHSIQQIDRLMDLKPERDPRAGPQPIGKVQGRITFTNVGLRYSRDADPVFAGLSFEVAPGELIAITGGNGTGKSTILKLTNRLYRPQAGSIRIDGIDIRQFDPVELRRLIAYVPESPDLFYGTFAENLRFANPLASDEDLQIALDRANAWDEIQTLPYGLDTIINGAEAEVVGGSLAYQISLARAYLTDSPIVLVDELPFSLLNSKSGEAYRTFLRESKGQRSVLFVTHRTDYVQMADKAIVMRREGRPIIGAPDEILQRYAA